MSVNRFLGRGLWEMESGAEWQESSVECPLVELMGTPAGDCDINTHTLVCVKMPVFASILVNTVI